MGRITDKQLALVLHFIDDPDAFMRSFLLTHPDFLANELAKGGQKRSARAALYRQRLRPCRSPAQSLMQLSLLPLDPPPCLRYFIRADGRHAGGITVHSVQGAPVFLRCRRFRRHAQTWNRIGGTPAAV